MLDEIYVRLLENIQGYSSIELLILQILIQQNLDTTGKNFTFILKSKQMLLLLKQYGQLISFALLCNL